MSQTGVSIVIAIVTLVLSAAISAFIAGQRWGEVRGDIRELNGRLARIEGMFEIRLRDPGGKP